MRKTLIVTSLIAIIVMTGITVYVQRQKAIDTAQIHSARAMSSRNLYWGAKGDDVRKVQQKLKQWDYLKGSVDGVYGKETYRAILNFQKKNGLVADGIVGPKTYAALGINYKQKKSSASVNNNDNVYMLASCIYGESRGEEYIGQVAVGAVILNRVEHPSFPNSIASVIYQPGAFTAVSDGQINLSPDEASIKAAKDALNGWDPTYGCRYYWNPSTATSKWIWSREVVVKIGRHWFGN